MWWNSEAVGVVLLFDVEDKADFLLFRVSKISKRHWPRRGGVCVSGGGGGWKEVEWRGGGMSAATSFFAFRYFICFVHIVLWRVGSESVASATVGIGGIFRPTFFFLFMFFCLLCCIVSSFVQPTNQPPPQPPTLPPAVGVTFAFNSTSVQDGEAGPLLQRGTRATARAAQRNRTEEARFAPCSTQERCLT